MARTTGPTKAELEAMVAKLQADLARANGVKEKPKAKRGDVLTATHKGATESGREQYYSLSFGGIRATIFVRQETYEALGLNGSLQLKLM